MEDTGDPAEIDQEAEDPQARARLLAAWTVTEPGLYGDMPAEAYHADPVPDGSLSSSGARQILPPGCPALFKYAPETGSRRLDFGTAAHTQLLGAGAPLHVIAADNWRKKATKEEAEQAKAAGQVPVLAKHAGQIKAMSAALAEHKSARQLFTDGSGLPEQSIFWEDDRFGIWRRARLDWLPFGANGLVTAVDYKTAAKADPDSVTAAIGRYGYHQQGSWYRDAICWLWPGIEVRFVLVFQEITYPHLVETYYLDGPALDEGAYKNRQAMEVYRDCTESGQWPGYNPEQTIEPIGIPRWARTLEDW
jgi:hypothetical protein